MVFDPLSSSGEQPAMLAKLALASSRSETMMRRAAGSLSDCRPMVTSKLLLCQPVSCVVSSVITLTHDQASASSSDSPSSTNSLSPPLPLSSSLLQEVTLRLRPHIRAPMSQRCRFVFFIFIIYLYFLNLIEMSLCVHIIILLFKFLQS